jgi:hypothetical protein
MQLPNNAATNGWYNVLPNPAPVRQPSRTIRVPYVVLGAGVTGAGLGSTLYQPFVAALFGNCIETITPRT